MSTCKDCRWWGSIEDRTDWGSFPGLNTKHRPCCNPKLGYDGYNSTESKADDAACSYSAIGTGPDFGCIHWEQLS